MELSIFSSLEHCVAHSSPNLLGISAIEKFWVQNYFQGTYPATIYLFVFIYYFTPLSSVSVVDFEQVNVSWVIAQKFYKGSSWFS